MLLNESIKVIIIFILGVIILAFAISSYVMKFIANPIMNLTKATDLISDGDLHYRVDVTREDEIGLLGKSFNKMLEKLDQSNKLLLDSNTLLESRVDARTDELSDTNETLKVALKAKASFLANMSHEIRTPMNGVIGMLQLLSETKLSAEQKDMVDTTKSSGDSLMTHFK